MKLDVPTDAKVGDVIRDDARWYRLARTPDGQFVAMQTRSGAPIDRKWFFAVIFALTAIVAAIVIAIIVSVSAHWGRPYGWQSCEALHMNWRAVNGAAVCVAP